MNNRGFTLVELLAVIVVLSLLALLASTSITKIVKDSKNDLYNTQIELIKAAAETWGSDNLNKLPDSGECKYIELYDLKAYGLLESSIINPKTNQEFSNDMYIKISSNLTPYGNLITNYEVDVTDVSACSPVYPSICTLASDSEKIGTELGAKYICKVDPNKDEYTFYVLSNNEDGTTNLIMNQNINSDGTPAGTTGVTQATNSSQYNLVAWNSSGVTTGGPVTAIQFLYNATKYWTNIPALNFIYNDKKYQGTTVENTSYTSFVSNSGITTITSLSGDIIKIGTEAEPLRARMPIYAFKDGTEYGEVADKKEDNSNAYLYDNLDSTGSAYTHGYWTLSSDSNHSGSACLVYFDENVDSDIVNEISYGVRPVITVRL